MKRKEEIKMEQSKELRIERRERRMNLKVMISQAPVQLSWLVILLTFTQNLMYKLCLSQPESYAVSPWGLSQHDWLTWRHIREPWNAGELHWCHCHSTAFKGCSCALMWTRNAGIPLQPLPHSVFRYSNPFARMEQVRPPPLWSFGAREINTTRI